MLKAKSTSPLPPVVIDLLNTVAFKAWRFQQYHRAIPVLRLLVDLADDEDAAVMLVLSQLAVGEPLADALLERVRNHSDSQLAAQVMERVSLHKSGVRA